MSRSRRLRTRAVIQRRIDHARQWLAHLEAALDRWVDDPSGAARWRCGKDVGRVACLVDDATRRVIRLDCERREP